MCQELKRHPAQGRMRSPFLLWQYFITDFEMVVAWEATIFRQTHIFEKEPEQQSIDAVKPAAVRERKCSEIKQRVRLNA